MIIRQSFQLGIGPPIDAIETGNAQSIRAKPQRPIVSLGNCCDEVTCQIMLSRVLGVGAIISIPMYYSTTTACPQIAFTVY